MTRFHGRSTFTSVIGVPVLLLMLALGTATAASPKPTLDECPSHLVCFTPAEAHRINVKLITLERDVKVAKIKKLKRFGTTIGCGAGHAFTTNEVNINCGVMWGFRF